METTEIKSNTKQEEVKKNEIVFDTGVNSISLLQETMPLKLAGKSESNDSKKKQVKFAERADSEHEKDGQSDTTNGDKMTQP